MYFLFLQIMRSSHEIAKGKCGGLVFWSQRIQHILRGRGSKTEFYFKYRGSGKEYRLYPIYSIAVPRYALHKEAVQSRLFPPQ